MTAEHLPIDTTQDDLSELITARPDSAVCLRTVLEEAAKDIPDGTSLAKTLLDNEVDLVCPQSAQGCGKFTKILGSTVLFSQHEDHQRQPDCRL